MTSDMRKRELEEIADNEVRLRGFNYGVSYLKNTYHLYDLTEEEAQAVSFLIRNAIVKFPKFPHHLV